MIIQFSIRCFHPRYKIHNEQELQNDCPARCSGTGRLKSRLDDAVRRVAYERRDSVTLARLVREILDGRLAGEAA